MIFQFYHLTCIKVTSKVFSFPFTQEQQIEKCFGESTTCNFSMGSRIRAKTNCFFLQAEKLFNKLGQEQRKFFYDLGVNHLLILHNDQVILGYVLSVSKLFIHGKTIT